LTDLGAYTFAVLDTNLFVGTYEGGVFMLSSGGTDWTAVNGGLTDLSVRTLAVCGKNLFVGTYGGGVFRSADYGRNWTQANSGLKSPVVCRLPFPARTFMPGHMSVACLSQPTAVLTGRESTQV